jgi:hypothetical protein
MWLARAGLAGEQDAEAALCEVYRDRPWPQSIPDLIAYESQIRSSGRAPCAQSATGARPR